MDHLNSLSSPPGPFRQASLLFWLKWRTLYNSARKDLARFVATVIALALALLSISIGGSVAVWYSLTLSPVSWHGEILNILFLFVTLVWLILPVITLSISEGMNLTRLFVLPISPRTMILGTTLGGFLDLATLAALPPLVVAGVAAAVPAGHPGFLGAFLGAAIAVIFLGATIAFSQLITAFTQRLLASRGGREILLLIASAVALSVGLAFQAVAPVVSGLAESGQPPQLSRWLIYLPSGWAAEGVLAVSQARPAAAVLAVIGLIAFGALGLMLGGFFIRRTLGRQVNTGRSSIRHPGRALVPFIPAQYEALARIQATSLGRSASGRIGLAFGLLLPVILSFLFSVGPLEFPGGFPAGQIAVYGAAAVTAFIFAVQFAANTFAYDASATRSLFTLPLKPITVLAGRNLALCILLLAGGSVSLTVSSAIAGVPAHALPAIVAMCSAFLALCGLANLSALWFPRKLSVTATQNNPAPLPTMLIFFIGSPLLLMPTAASVAADLIFGTPMIFTLPVAMIVSAALYVGGLMSAAAQLPALQERIIENVGR